MPFFKQYAVNTSFDIIFSKHISSLVLKFKLDIRFKTTQTNKINVANLSYHSTKYIFVGAIVKEVENVASRKRYETCNRKMSGKTYYFWYINSNVFFKTV